MTTVHAGFAAPTFEVSEHSTARAALQWTGALVVGAGLVTFAALKMYSQPQFAQSWLLGPVEILAAVALVALRTRWWAWAGVAALFAAFAGHTAFLWSRGAESCGCAGAFTTPPAVMFSADVAVVAFALLMAVWSSTRQGALGIALTGAGFGSMLGLGFVAAVSPPPASAYVDVETGVSDPAEKLLTLPVMADVMSMSRPTDPAWYVFVYDRHCHVCESLKPAIEEYMNQAAADDVLRVKMVEMNDLAALEPASHQIPRYAWGAPPVGLVVEQGRIVQRFEGKAQPDVRALRQQMTDAPGPLQRLMQLDLVSDIVNASHEPAWLLYVHSGGCGECIRYHNQMMAFSESSPDDPDLRILSLASEDLEVDGIPAASWPSIRSAYLFRAGEIVKTWGPEEIPDPVELWLDLQDEGEFNDAG